MRKDETHTETDETLVRRVVAGETEAFAPLVRKYESRVKTMIAQRVGPSSEVEDMAQDVLVKAYTHLAQFRGEAAFATWLHRLTINYCWDVLRRRGRSLESAWEDLPPHVQAASENAAIPSDPPEDWEARRRQVAQTLQTLPDLQREILVLREIEGRSYDEIATLLGVALGTVESRLHRARRILQERLTQKEAP